MAFFSDAGEFEVVKVKNLHREKKGGNVWNTEVFCLQTVDRIHLDSSRRAL